MSYRYAWVISSLYLTGNTAGITISVCLWTTWIAILVFYFYVYRTDVVDDQVGHSKSATDKEVQPSSAVAPPHPQSPPPHGMYFQVVNYTVFWSIITVNIVLMSVINIYFVATSFLYAGNPTSVINAISAGLSIFKGTHPV